MSNNNKSKYSSQLICSLTAAEPLANSISLPALLLIFACKLVLYYWHQTLQAEVPVLLVILEVDRKC